MPWKACKPMDERLKFIARLLDGEKMAGLCREFGVSRKTGYKILSRYNSCGLEGLTDRSRRPDVDDQFELGRLFDRNLCWIGSLENLVDRPRDRVESFPHIGAVCDDAARSGKG